ncbi:MAG: MotA/TolQ/ExbB proton channel family protein [Bacteroidetes bacterium]|nr:MotA/TolQ/ExbB proton channel family protein [Bacteroidota bacterium]MBK8586934.1 MotA/TolQ/ExbB proton channel family protein [Bacteroidota bacterium]
MIGFILQITQTGTMAADSLNNAAATMTPPVEQSISLWEMAVKGGPILYPIAILSIAAFYIFFERYITIRKLSKVDRNFMNQIRDYVHSGNIDSAKALCRNTNTPVSRMIEKGIMRLGKPVKEIEGAIENVGKLEIFKMEKNMNILNSISGIAPMFGFLGTIFGVIKIFYQIAQQNSLEINTISGGLYVKMISSASGLLVGMIAYAAYHYLTFMIDRVINRMEVNAVEFIDLLEEPVKR